MKLRRRLLAAVSALVAAVPVTLAAAPAHAVGPALLPVTVTNSTGRGDAVYLYVIGVNLTTGRLGYVNAGRHLHRAGPAGRSRRRPRRTSSIAGPGNGGSTTIQFPRGLLRPRLLLLRREAQVLPHPGRPGAARAVGRRRRQPRHPVRLERVHLQRRRPVAQQLAGRHVRGAARGHGHRRHRRHQAHRRRSVANGRNNVINSIKAQSGLGQHRRTPAPTAPCCGCSRPARRPAPACSAPPTWTRTSPSAWNAYTTKTLTVVPFTDQPNINYFGRTSRQRHDLHQQRPASRSRPSTSPALGERVGLRRRSRPRPTTRSSARSPGRSARR